MTQSTKHGKKLKTARNIGHRKAKERRKRQNAEKYAARTGKAPAAV